MKRWLVCDTLYCPEAFPFGHLDATCHYLAQMGFEVKGWALNGGSLPPRDLQTDVVLAMDRFDVMARQWGAVRVAQVAAVCQPMPWECLRQDGAPAYDLVVSSIPWMVEAAREAGCRAEYVPLCFDTRALACGMGVKERDLGCIFIGSVGPNHQRRTQLLAELSDVVTVLPPVFGHEYFKTLARAKVVFNVHAEWARGAANNMRMFEATGMGAALVHDGDMTYLFEHEDDGHCFRSWPFESVASAREGIAFCLAHADEAALAQRRTLADHTYTNRIPRLVELVRSVMP